MNINFHWGETAKNCKTQIEVSEEALVFKWLYLKMVWTMWTIGIGLMVKTRKSFSESTLNTFYYIRWKYEEDQTGDAYSIGWMTDNFMNLVQANGCMVKSLAQRPKGRQFNSGDHWLSDK